MKIRYPAIATIVLILLINYLDNSLMLYAVYENWNIVESIILMLIAVCFCYTIYLVLKAIWNKFQRARKTGEEPLKTKIEETARQFGIQYGTPEEKLEQLAAIAARAQEPEKKP